MVDESDPPQAQPAGQDLASDLRMERELIERILEAVPSGVVHVSPKGAILRANAKAQAFLGLGFDELTRRYTSDFAGATTYEDGSPCPVSEYPVSRCLMTGEPQPTQTLGVGQPNGELRWGMFTAIPLDMPEGKGAVVSFVDITDRKVAEEERLELEERIRSNERLASMGALAASMAHEINNPLTFVLGNLALLEEDLEDAAPAVTDRLSAALSGANRIGRIVGDLNHLARSERDALARQIDVHEALEQALTMVHARLALRARLRRDFAATRLVMADESSLVQVFVNVLVNSIDATVEGDAEGNEILVRTWEEADAVLVGFEDTGSGIEEAVLKRVLDPFFTTKEPGHGTGLGLSISHGILARWGGTLTIERREGRGTRVCIRLRQSDHAPPSPKPSPVKRPVPRGLRVLVVDDEPLLVDFVSTLLSACDVAVAYNGGQALERCAEGSFDLIVCDLMMPQITGMELYNRLRRQAPEQAARMLFMTGGAYSEAAERFAREVPQPVLLKPFTVQMFYEAVEGLLP